MNIVILPATLPAWFVIAIFAVTVFVELLLCALPALLWALIGRQKLTEAFAWRQASDWEYLGAVMLALGSVPWVTHTDLDQPYILAFELRYPVSYTLAFSLSAAFCEELLFRGPLLRAFIKRMPVWVAIGLTSLLFAAAHFEFDFESLVQRTFFGVLVAVVVLRGRSIFPAMLIHFLYDAILTWSTIWAVDTYGLHSVLWAARRSDKGIDHLELLLIISAKIVLVVLGWLICSAAWRRKKKAAT